MKKLHEMAEQGKPLNEKIFSEIYESLFREYNGDSLVFDEEVKYGWSRIPHFYRPFYVYKTRPDLPLPFKSLTNY